MKLYRNFSKTIITSLTLLSLMIAGMLMIPSCGEDDTLVLGSISARVISELDRQSLNGVKVHLHHDEGSEDYEIPNVDGSFTKGELPLGRYKVTATRAGFLDYERTVPLALTNNNPDATIEIAMKPLGALAGTVKNSRDNTIITNATVVLSNTQEFRAISDNQGQFRFENLDAGDYTLKVNITGYELFQDDLIIKNGELNNLLVPLRPNPSISGQVLEKDSENPLINVSASLTGLGARFELSTDSNGKFSFQNLSPGDYQLLLERQGYLDIDDPIKLDSGQYISKDYLMSKIPEKATANISVINDKTEETVQGVQLSMTGPKTGDFLTNENGFHSIPNLDAGDYIITATKEGYESTQTDFNLAQSETRDVIIRLPPLGSINGKVTTTENMPLQSVRVTLSGESQAEIISDNSGEFIFNDLTKGDYLLTLTKEGFLGQEAAITLKTSETANKIYQLVTAPKVATVKGKVFNSENEAAVANVKIALTGTTNQEQFSDENGNYSFQDIPPGSYQINTNKEGFEQNELDFELVDNEERTLNIPLVPRKAELSVSPLVLDFGEDKNILPLEIRNTSEGTLDWGITENISWVTPSLLNGTTVGSETKTVIIQVDRTSLNQGDYSNVLTVSSNGGNQLVTIKANVVTELCVTPSDLNFGTSTESKSVFVENCGSGTVDYSIVTDKTWLTASPTSGAVKNEKEPITVSVNHDGLNPGNYTGQVIFNSNSGPSEVFVVMTVPNLNEPQLTLSDTELNFGSNQGEKVITVSNTGKQKLNWNLAKEQGWITVSPSLGELEEGESQNIIVEVFRGGLTPNNYEGQLEFTSNGGQRNIPVKMNVAATPVLDLSTQILDFGHDFTELTFDINNIGNSTLQWEAETDVNWLTVVPRAGTDAGTITVFVKRENVSDGGYNAEISINSNGGVSSIAVSMIKAPPPPNLILESVTLKSDENESGAPNPGEKVVFTFTLKNDNGASEAKDISVNFSSNSPYINSFSPNGVNFGNIGINESKEMDVEIDFSDLAVVGTEVPINLTIRDIYGSSWSQDIKIEIKSFYIVSQGLLAYFRFDEGDFRDETGQHNGNDFGPKHTSDTPSGEGLSIEFNSEEKDFFQTAQNIIRYQQQGTFNFWIKTNHNNVYIFTSSLHRSVGRNRLYISTQNRIWANSRSSSDATGFATDISHKLLDGSWHMLTVSIKRNEHRLYIDGILEEEFSLSDPLEDTANSEGFAFGKRSGENDLYFNGKMDNIRIYNRVLTKAEVKLLFDKKQ